MLRYGRRDVKRPSTQGGHALPRHSLSSSALRPLGTAGGLAVGVFLFFCAAGAARLAAAHQASPVTAQSRQI